MNEQTLKTIENLLAQTDYAAHQESRLRGEWLHSGADLRFATKKLYAAVRALVDATREAEAKP